MKTVSSRAAFTLIELLVVISIIAILAGLAMPVLTKILMNGRQANALNSARQIGLSLQLCANDNDGDFPQKRNSYGEAINTSNDAFRSLVPRYLDNEKVFAIAGSKTGPSVDGNVSSAAKIVSRGENHWAYIEGLNTTSNSTWPLVVDHTDGTGSFTSNEAERGGTWKGTKAVVIKVDTSAQLVPLIGPRTKRYIPMDDELSKNMLMVVEYMGKLAQLREPAL